LVHWFFLTKNFLYFIGLSKCSSFYERILVDSNLKIYRIYTTLMLDDILSFFLIESLWLILIYTRTRIIKKFSSNTIFLQFLRLLTFANTRFNFAIHIWISSISSSWTSLLNFIICPYISSITSSWTPLLNFVICSCISSIISSWTFLFRWKTSSSSLNQTCYALRFNHDYFSSQH